MPKKKRDLPPGWETDEGGKSDYSPTKFYTGSVDAMGHGTTIHVKVADYMIPVYQSLKEALPQYYKSIADILRDGGTHRREWLQANFAHILSDPRQQMYLDIEHAATLMKETKHFSSLPSKVREICRELRNNDAHEALADYIDMTTSNAEGYPEPWRTKVLEELARCR